MNTLAGHPAIHSSNNPGVARIARLRPAGFQKGFEDKPGFPLFSIVELIGATDTDKEFWLQSTVTRAQVERQGFTVEII